MRATHPKERDTQALAIAVQDGYHTEHNTDDSHKTIHATGSVFERGRTTAAMGDSINVPFMATDYAAIGAMTWTVAMAGLLMASYALVGARMFYDISISPSTIGGSVGTALTIKIPGGFYANRTTVNACQVTDNGTKVAGLITATKNSNLLQVSRLDGANFSLSAGNAGVSGHISFETRTA